MWIKRDFLNNFDSETCLEAIFVRGPRQTGKSTLLNYLPPPLQTSIYLDDPNVRQRAKEDPEFVLSQSKFPLLIDEAHLAPELFFSLKKKIDEARRARMNDPSKALPAASIRMTGSNLTEVNRSIQETLAGRVNIFYLHGLSWNEIIRFDSSVSLGEYCFRGGFPELWIRKELNPIEYLNDYISTFIEKDLGRSIGLEKRHEFINVIRLLAARVGELLNFESIGNDADVAGKTVKHWLSLLEENRIIYLLPPYSSNLSKRLVKMPKPYFLDLGLCSRFQAHPSAETIFNSPQSGHLFECMVISEVIKAKDHFRKDWNLSFYRTKEKEEIDLILEKQDEIILMEVKLGSSAKQSITIPKIIQATGKKIKCFVITASGEPHFISPTTQCIPISRLVEVISQ